MKDKHSLAAVLATSGSSASPFTSIPTITSVSLSSHIPWLSELHAVLNPPDTSRKEAYVLGLAIEVLKERIAVLNRYANRTTVATISAFEIAQLEQIFCIPVEHDRAPARINTINEHARAMVVCLQEAVDRLTQKAERLIPAEPFPTGSSN
ncbi:MAG: hypothetical protein RL094_570 [Candidatus Parcubacteria bacterium]|jgi:hypothetical protein